MRSLAAILLLTFSTVVHAQEWTVVPQRHIPPPQPQPRMCWVTHREPDYWVTVPGHWEEPCPCDWGPWHWENGHYVRYCDWVWVPATRKLIRGKTYKRWEVCSKRHILGEEQEDSNGVVNPDDHPVESRNRGVLSGRRTRTTLTCE